VIRWFVNNLVRPRRNRSMSHQTAALAAAFLLLALPGVTAANDQPMS
jgi:hypothetical protein